MTVSAMPPGRKTVGKSEVVVLERQASGSRLRLAVGAWCSGVSIVAPRRPFPVTCHALLHRVDRVCRALPLQSLFRGRYCVVPPEQARQEEP